MRASIHRRIGKIDPSWKSVSRIFLEKFIAIIMPRGSARRDCLGDSAWNDRGGDRPLKNLGTLMKWKVDQ
jgi:hypothetical protein